MPSYVITGTSRGLGLAFIKNLGADESNTVFAVVRSLEASKELLEFVKTLGHKNVHVIEASNADTPAIQAAAEAVGKVTGGKLDVLILNGALMHHEHNSLALDGFEDPDVLDKTMTSFFKTNVLGTIHMINAFLPLLRAGELKKCALITSTLGSPKFTVLTDFVFAPGYSISKAAMNLVSAKYAAQYKKEGIVFLSITPGLVRTKLGPKEEVDEFYKQQVAQIRAMFPTFEGDITPEQSVRDQLNLIHNATIEQTGAFVNRDGTDAEARV